MVVGMCVHACVSLVEGPALVNSLVGECVCVCVCEGPALVNSGKCVCVFSGDLEFSTIFDS